MSLLIHKPGILASIQDSGRFGYQHWGVPISGAMDILSMQAANLLSGNDPAVAAVECTLHGTLIEFQEPHQFAITGGGAIATLNNNPISFNQLISAAMGDLLQLHPSPYGCRSYIAVSGGFAVEPELNSCSSYPPAKLGGMGGSYLKAGDILPVRAVKKVMTSNTIQKENKVFDNPALTSHQLTIRTHRGPEWDWFKEEAKQHFINCPWIVGASSNRMGYLLEGPILEKNNTQELISTAVTSGIVQVTPSGKPIILMADAQTIGGYPRIARISGSDIPIIAQCRPGVQLNFELQ